MVQLTAVINALSKFLSYIPLGVSRKQGELIFSLVLHGAPLRYSWTNFVNLVRQHNLETTFGTNYKFIEGNNPFGMNVPSWSPYVQGSIGSVGTARYANISQAVADRITWDKRNNISGWSSTYLEELVQHHYNNSPTYPNAVAGTKGYETALLVASALVPASIIGIGYLVK